MGDWAARRRPLGAEARPPAPSQLRPRTPAAAPAPATDAPPHQTHRADAPQPGAFDETIAGADRPARASRNAAPGLNRAEERRDEAGPNLEPRPQARGPRPTRNGIHAGPVGDEPTTNVRGQAHGRAFAAALDIGGQMTGRAYNATVTASPSRRASRGFFSQQEQAAAQRTAALDAEITAEQARTPPNAQRLEELQQLRTLSASVQSLYGELRQNDGSQEERAGRVLQQIAAVEQALTNTPTALIGEQNAREMRLHLLELSTVIGGFDEMRARGEAGALDVFVLRTHRRLQQIDRGQRRRANEPASVEGALQSYRNDQSDARIFQGRFRQLQTRLDNGEFRSQAEFETAMLGAVRGTSTTFRQGVQLLARARWQSHRATHHASAGSEMLNRAAASTRAAFTELQSAEADLGMTSQQAQLSQHALTQRNSAGAREAVETADGLRQEAQTHLAEYDRLMAGSRRQRRAAQAHLRVAAAYVRASNATLGLIEAGRFGNLVSNEAAAVRTHNRTLGGQIRTLSQGAIELGRQQQTLQESRASLEAWSNDLGTAITHLEAGVSLGELEDHVDVHVGQGANRAHDAIAASFNGVALSDEARAFLEDPSSVDPDDVADVREELTEVFEQHPQVAQRVAEQIVHMRSEFTERRETMVQQFGADSAEVRALDSIEHGYLQSWLQKDAIVVEALFRAQFANAGTAAATGQLQNWMSAARGRYSRHLLADPERSAEASTQFHSWMVQQESMNERYQEVVEDYGSPESQVTMTLHLEQSGQLVTFNAYVFRDGDEYKALNPLDGRIYSGNSQAAALARLGREAELGEGTVRYQQGGQMREARSAPPPEGSLAADIGMGAVGVVGGILLFAPEPTTLTKWGGGAMVAASSAYFVGKGSMAMADLIEHETFGNNAQTWGATLDIASGLLMGLRGAGALSAMARTESQVAAHLARIGQSASLTRAELATMGAGIGLAGHGLAQVYADQSLSDREKITAAGEMLAAFAIPVGLVAGYRGMARVQQGRANRAQTTEAHQNYLGRLGETEALARRIARSERPEVRAQLRRSLDQVVAGARELYDSPAMRARPELRRAGLAAIERLDTVRTSLPEAPAGRAPAAPDMDGAHSVDQMQGYRQTVGWSGEPTATPPRGQAHRAAIQRGLDRLPEAARQRLQGHMDRASFGSEESNQRLANIHQRHGQLLRELQEANRLGQTDRAAQISAELEGIPARVAHAELLKARQMRQDRGRAVAEMAALRQQLLGPEGPARARAEQITLDNSVENPQAVRDAATLFFQLTGDLVDPSSLTMRQTQRRGQATRASGEIQVGSGEASTVLHELGHFGEWADPTIHSTSASWRSARGEEAVGEVRTRPLNELTDSTRFEGHETAVEDHFASEYVGKVYGDRTSEVFTTGIERFATPQSMLDFYMQDPEHFFLTLSFLQGTPP